MINYILLLDYIEWCIVYFWLFIELITHSSQYEVKIVKCLNKEYFIKSGFKVFVYNKNVFKIS